MVMAAEKDVLNAEKSGKETDQLFSPPSEKNFSVHLNWHIGNGTRPDGEPGTPGEAWEVDQFVIAYDAARKGQRGRKRRSGEPVRGDVSKNLRNWRRGKRCYLISFKVIEKVFFGENAAYDLWRAQFRAAWSAQWKGEATGAVSAQSLVLAERNQNEIATCRHEETQTKLDAILAAIKPQVEATSGRVITESFLRAIVFRIEERMRDAPIEDILRYIDEFVEASQRENEARILQSNRVPDLVELRIAALKLLDKGQLDDVSNLFNKELERRRSARRERAAIETSEDLAILSEAADYDRLAFNISGASERYFQMAELLFPEEFEQQFNYLHDTSHRLHTEGASLGDHAFLLVSIELNRELISKIDRASRPRLWAITQANLGVALTVIGEWETGITRLMEAVDALRAALEEELPGTITWNFTQVNLGRALLYLGEREADPEHLKEAISLFERVGPDVNLGSALAILGEREKGTVRLKKSVRVFRRALTQCNREENPLEWARIQNNLGRALSSLGNRENDLVTLNEGVDLLRRALSIRTRERVPLEWAMTQKNLGDALTHLGKRENDISGLQEATAAFHEALTIRTHERLPFDRLKTQESLAFVEELIASRKMTYNKL